MKAKNHPQTVREFWIASIVCCFDSIPHITDDVVWLWLVNWFVRWRTEIKKKKKLKTGWISDSETFIIMISNVGATVIIRIITIMVVRFAAHALVKRISLRQEVAKNIDEPRPHNIRESGQEEELLSSLPLLQAVSLENMKLHAGNALLADEKYGSYFLKPELSALSLCCQFQRDDRFWQMVTAYPATSHFVSAPSHQPGTSEELHREGVRLATFKDFPVSVPVSSLRLAQAGFYYLGERDQVKCFSCGQTYEGWQVGDQPAIIHAQISPNCTMVSGSHETNQTLPGSNLPSLTNSELSMEESGYDSIISDPGNVSDSGSADTHPDWEPFDSSRPMAVSSAASSSQILANAGPSYARDGTRSWIPSSSNGSALAISESRVAPAAASATILSSVATPGNSMFSGSPHTHTAPTDRGGSCHLSLPSQRLDPRGAVYPLYMQRDDRRRSFSTWTSPGLPPVDELVDLGFFYAGYADCVRCFYCGVGLRSWEPDDIPAEVHARWRPTCQYLRLMKGDEFVDAVASGMALIPRRAVSVIAQCNEDQREGRLRGQQRQTLHQSPPVWHQHHPIVPAVAFPCGHRLCLHCMPRPVRHCPVCRQCVIRLVPQ